MNEYNRSAGRKGINTSLVFAGTLDPKKQCHRYHAIAGTDACYGLFICLAHMGEIREFFPYRIAKEIEEYYKIDDGSDEPIIDDHYFNRLPGSDHSTPSNTFKGTAYVKSISKGKVVTHRVNSSNVVHSLAPKEKKKKAIRFMNFSCDCNYFGWALNLTAPINERRAISDFRLYDDIPGPEIGVVWCKDVNALMHLGVEKRGWESYGFWGLHGQVMEFLQTDVLTVLRTKRKDSTKLSKYKVNEHLLFHTDFFDPLLEWIEKT